jgi:hypothetical protein
MGTSTAYGGPNGGTPLVPSWLGGEAGGTAPATAPVVATEGGAPQDGAPQSPPDRPPIPPTADPHRFTAARTNFTRFAGSGGRDRASLGRAISQYVTTSSGGSRQAAQRMGASRAAGARLLNFLADAQARGVGEALRSIDLESLAGRPAAEIFIGLADYICPGAGTVDDGIAREAYVETVIDLAEAGLVDLNTFTLDQMETVFELFATHAIEARICNDIGTKAVMMPADAAEAIRVERQLRDFVRGAVSDALTSARQASPNLTQQQVQTFVDRVYELAFSFLHALGEGEANS